MTTASVRTIDAPGVSDFDLPMIQHSVKMRISWLRTLKSIASTRAARDDKECDPSKLIREALRLWADENEISLDGF